MCIPFLLDVYRGWKGNTLDTWREVMRMPWAKDIKSLAEAVPPKYTELNTLEVTLLKNS